MLCSCQPSRGLLLLELPAVHFQHMLLGPAVPWWPKGWQCRVIGGIALLALVLRPVPVMGNTPVHAIIPDDRVVPGNL